MIVPIPTEVKNQLRAIYSRIVHGNVIVIVAHDQGKSVTNDADNVIADLAADFDLSKYLVIYRDTRGICDQLLVDRTGNFAGFSSINERDLSSALNKREVGMSRPGPLALLSRVAAEGVVNYTI
jgi:hypothetical protein